MTEDEINALAKELVDLATVRSRRTALYAALNGELDEVKDTSLDDFAEAKAVRLISSLRASLANAERRAEDAEARALFFETEMTRILQEAKK